MIQENVDGATPLDLDEAEGLLPSHIETKSELNEWEQANIAKAVAWLGDKRPEPVLTMEFLRELHYRMFDDTWRWAGKFRKTEKTIGVAPESIPENLKNLLDDAKYWIEHKTHSTDEIGARFHHRLVNIHPFPNGNGRHGRLMTDMLLDQLGVKRFTWGESSREGEQVRDSYRSALQRADAGDYAPLLKFVRS